ncbi:molybdopterin-binding protein [Mycobacterium sp.]|uniref:molybdopterin-binding protein n=1 Tax=Mycobacterium sp. TaxID=1785 RepID=UPI001227F935|nr:molybdopterin-binding protein [Mycobacterium sp.]TAM64497.1 MAG: competence/damage-inducible protein A [Mycobacterium sp.]
MPDLDDGLTLDLLDKRELRVEGIALREANLGALAGVVASALDLSAEEVLVTDVLGDVVTFDILRPKLYGHQLVGRWDAIRQGLANVPGVVLQPDARITSNGVLGWIPTDPEMLDSALAQARSAAEGIAARIARRVCVLSTGAEVDRGEIEDTNRQTLSDAFGDAYDVSFGGTVRDDHDLIAGRIRNAVEAGYGVVVTTGGVGAESKDHTIEALLKVDPNAATPYLAYFPSGEHPRHVKAGIRIGVGELRGSVIVCLPGPNEEVRLAAPILLERFQAGKRGADLAEPIAAALRAHLRTCMNHLDHQSGVHE